MQNEPEWLTKLLENLRTLPWFNGLSLEESTREAANDKGILINILVDPSVSIETVQNEAKCFLDKINVKVAFEHSPSDYLQWLNDR